MNQLAPGSPVRYQSGPLHNGSAVITGLPLAEQLPQLGHYHLMTSSALDISAQTTKLCVLFRVRSQSTSAALMQRNLFIIIGVNVIVVEEEGGRGSTQTDGQGAKRRNSCSDFKEVITRNILIHHLLIHRHMYMCTPGLFNICVLHKCTLLNWC